MKLATIYTFSDQEIKALDLILDHLLTSYKFDLNYLEEAVGIMALLEWYKFNLGTFKFPEKENEIEMNSTVSLAFLLHFRDFDNDSYESIISRSICRDIITKATGGRPVKYKTFEE